MTDLEERMRPGQASYGGFLGENEKLDEILNVDAATVQRLGVTHEQIAARLEYFLETYFKEYADIVERHFDEIRNLPFEERVKRRLDRIVIVIDGIYQVLGDKYRGFQVCPWELRDGDNFRTPMLIYSDSEITIKNLKTGESEFVPGLIAHLIREHKFFEGKESPYRVDPERVVRILNIEATSSSAA